MLFNGYQPRYSSREHVHRMNFRLEVMAHRPPGTKLSLADAIWKMRGDATQYHPKQAERVIAGKALLHSA